MSDMTTVKDEVKAKLEANIPTELARLDALFNDGITTEPATDYHTAETVVIEGFPHCEIVGIRSVPQTARDEYVQEYEHEVTVLWTIIGYDELMIVKQVERSILATRNILWRTQLDGSSMPMRPGAEDYSMLSHTKKGFAAPLIKGGAITVYVKALDDQPIANGSI